MIRNACVAALLLAVASPTTVSGQHADGGLFELGTSATYNRYDPDRLGLAPDFGLGVRAGWFLTPVLSIEAIAARGLTHDVDLASRVEVTELGGTALASLWIAGRNQIFVGVGYSRLEHSGPADFVDQAAHVVLGDRVPLTGGATMRVQARAIHTPSSNAPPGSGGRALTFELSAGLSLFVGSRRARDSDGDLIPDSVDRCPDTPAALVVDGSGCPRDPDGDGVFDGVDECWGTPGGAPVDPRGCVLDTDRDDVADHLDRCPGTTIGTQVDAAGCPPDADGDAVPDAVDRCPGTPVGVRVDAGGCAVDEDGDGVPDHEDGCPDTAPGQRVDASGCVIFFEDSADRRAPLELTGVTFELGQAVLTPESYAALDPVAQSLLAYPEVRVEVAGHTDDLGSEELNLELSLARAQAVRDYLVTQGVRADRLEARGYGSEQPIASNATEEGRARNRRVELRRIGGS